MDEQERFLSPISTLDDPRISDYRHLTDPRALERAGLFVAEGRWVVERLLARPQYTTCSVLMTPAAQAALSRRAADALARVPVYIAEQALMNRIAGFNIHRGCVALAVKPPAVPLDAAIPERARRIVVLEGVSNPDNIGGIFRSAAAFGVDLIVLGPSCGDPLYRKAIRTSMAATLDVPYASSTDWASDLEAIRTTGLRLVAFTAHPGAPTLASIPADTRVAMLFGTEGSGLTAQALQHADAQVHIRTSGQVDSLNVAVAASIAMHYFNAGT